MYKLKFLHRIDTGAKGNKADKVYHSVSLSDSEIELFAKNWRTTGMIELVEVQSKGKLKEVDVIKLFYSEADDEDKKIKDALLEKYGPKFSESLAKKREEAKELGIKGYALMSEETLDKKIEEIKKS